jgi:hypothetical protein
MSFLIEAFNRKSKHTVKFNGGIDIVFEPNDKGHCVALVRDKAIADRLLDIPTGFRPYGPQLTLASVLLASGERPRPPVRRPKLDEQGKPIEGAWLDDENGNPLDGSAPQAAAADEGGNVATSDTPVADETPPPPTDAEQFILVNGDQRLDLKTMDDKALHEFAKANKVTVHHAAKGNTIRFKLIEALSVQG